MRINVIDRAAIKIGPIFRIDFILWPPISDRFDPKGQSVSKYKNFVKTPLANWKKYEGSLWFREVDGRSRTIFISPATYISIKNPGMTGSQVDPSDPGNKSYRLQWTMKRILHISWNHFLRSKDPCIRTTDTGRTFRELVQIVCPLLEKDGIEVLLEQVVLPPGTPPEREGFFLNGRPLIELLFLADQAEFLCRSSKCQEFRESVRVTPGPDGSSCLEAPEILFRKAVLQALEET